MKVVVFAGGFGTRFSEETGIRPKPMVEIGGRPILWHIMTIYAKFGLTDFVVLGGYKVEYIQQYFLNYRRTNSDFTIDLATGDITTLQCRAEPWRVTVMDTGLETMTGGRLKRARAVIGDGPFCLTYGDGVCDLDISDLIAFHKSSGAWATVTAVSQPGRFGALGIDSETESVRAFREKAAGDGGLINGGFFVCENAVFDLIDGDDTVWEQEPMDRLVEAGRLSAYRHLGFWHSMDTLRDQIVLDRMCKDGTPPWLK